MVVTLLSALDNDPNHSGCGSGFGEIEKNVIFQNTQVNVKVFIIAMESEEYGVVSMGQFGRGSLPTDQGTFGT